MFWWLKDGKPEEHFLEAIHVTKPNAETITLDFSNHHLRMRGMGFDGAAMFSGRKTGGPDEASQVSPHVHVTFIHCRNKRACK